MRLDSALKKKSSPIYLGPKNLDTIQLEQEPDNPKDSNAILVKVCVDDLFLIIGYIGVKKLPKVVSAIRLQEIVDIKSNP